MNMIKNDIDKYSYEFFEKLPEKFYFRYLRKIYTKIMGKRLNLDNPKCFSEKIQWLKLNDNLPIKTKLADKLAVRDWVRERIPELKFTQIYSVGRNFDELDFSKCPECFVIKTNHACRQMIKVTNKSKFFSPEEKEKLKTYKSVVKFWLSRHFAFNSGFELQYKNIPRRVYAEEFIDNGCSEGYSDYKVYCFNGVPKFIEYFINGKVAIFDTNWNELEVCYEGYPRYSSEKHLHTSTQTGGLSPLKKLPNILEYAAELSKNFKFVRIDFFEHREAIYLGEMTFTPHSGFFFFNPKKYDIIFGDMLNLK